MAEKKAGDSVPREDRARERMAQAINGTIERYTARGLNVDDISDGKKTIADYKAEIKKLRKELKDLKDQAAAEQAKG